jgi:flagellar hook-length control protein FliK
MPSQQTVPTIFRIEMPIHDEKWGQVFASRVAWQIAENIQEAQIHVNPLELGPVEVRVRVSEDQATVHFHTQHGQARETIEKAIPELREVLSQSGLHLADANVSQGSSGYEREHAGRLVPRMREVSDNGTTKHEEPASLSETHQQAGLIDAYV